MVNINKFIIIMLVDSLIITSCDNNVGSSYSVSKSSQNKLNKTELNSQQNLYKEAIYFTEIGDNKAQLIFIPLTNTVIVIDAKYGLRTILDTAFDEDQDDKELDQYINSHSFKSILDENGNAYKPDNMHAVIFDAITSHLYWLQYKDSTHCVEYSLDLNTNLQPQIVTTFVVKGVPVSDVKLATFEDSGITNEWVVNLQYEILNTNVDGETNKLAMSEIYSANILEYSLDKTNLLDTRQPMVMSAKQASGYYLTGKPTMTQSKLIQKYFPNATVGEYSSQETSWKDKFADNLIATSVISTVLALVSFGHYWVKNSIARNYFRDNFSKDDLPKSLTNLNVYEKFLVSRVLLEREGYYGEPGGLSKFAFLNTLQKSLRNLYVTDKNRLVKINRTYINFFTNFKRSYMDGNVTREITVKEGQIYIDDYILKVDKNGGYIAIDENDDFEEYVDIKLENVNKILFDHLNTLYEKTKIANIYNEEITIKIAEELKLHKYNTQTMSEINEIKNGDFSNIWTTYLNPNNITTILLKQNREVIIKNSFLGAIYSLNTVISQSDNGNYWFAFDSRASKKEINAYIERLQDKMKTLIVAEVARDENALSAYKGQKSKYAGIVTTLSAVASYAMLLGETFNIYSVGCGDYLCNSVRLASDGVVSSNNEFYLSDAVYQTIPFVVGNKNYSLHIVQDFGFTCSEISDKLPQKPQKIYAIGSDGKKYLISDVNNNLCPFNGDIQNFVW